MKLRTIVAVAGLAAMSLAACGSGAGGSGEDVIKVAVLDAQSGKFSDFGIDVERGARMAFDEINEAGGVTVGGKTYKFKYEITDLQSDPTVAAQAAQQAVSGGTKILIGATVSALTEPITGVVQRSGGQVLQIGMATSLDRHVGKKDPIFRTLPSDEVMAKQYIPVLRKEFPDVKTIGSLMINDAVGQSILKIYTPLFEENGFKVASQDTFPSDETNFAPLLQRSAKDAQAFFVGYTDPVGKAVVNAALEAGKAKIFFNRGSVCQVGMEFGDKIDAFACQIVGDDPVKPSSDEAKQWFAKYEREFKTKPNANVAYAISYYDTVYLLKQALEKAGTVDDVQKIADALRGAQYKGISEIGFDESGLSTTKIRVGIVRKGELSVHEGARLS